MATETETAKNASGTPFEFALPNDNGREDAANSRPVVLSNEDKAALDALKTSIEGATTPYFNKSVGNTKYLVAAGAQVLTDYFIENPDATNKAYLQIFDAATIGAVTLGATAPKWSLGLEPKQKANLSNLALGFSAGIVIAGTTTVDGNAAAVTGLVINLASRAG